MIFLIDGISTPIPIATVANTTLTVDDGDESSFKMNPSLSLFVENGTAQTACFQASFPQG